MSTGFWMVALLGFLVGVPVGAIAAAFVIRGRKRTVI